MRHTLSILVENRYGELARIVGLFSARGYNIESLTVAETLDPAISCVTMVTSGDDRTVEQIVKQVNKLVRVVKVSDLTGVSHFEREMVLINVKAGNQIAFQRVLQLVSQNQMRVAEVMDDGLIIEATGKWEEMNELVRELMPFGIRGIVRTGAVALAKDSTEETVGADLES
ncbi:MAG TPA: acetolactate synthase small subunit [Candidatus Angelobacter sp.]|jgi:acetolactate synthase-1/3 small subunit|nr:acetolactate synthase small subunit [Candidatus Angelobacter sp.]